MRTTTTGQGDLGNRINQGAIAFLQNSIALNMRVVVLTLARWSR
jgi:hypothetical protein